MCSSWHQVLELALQHVEEVEEKRSGVVRDWTSLGIHVCVCVCVCVCVLYVCVFRGASQERERVCVCVPLKSLRDSMCVCV
jgi:hypothetical protein